MGDHDNRLTRLRYTATGAVAALAAAGAIAAAVAVADAPPAKQPGTATPPSGLAKPAPASCASAADASGKAPGLGRPDKGGATADKGGAAAPSDVPQAFFDAVQRLVDNGTITAAEGQAVDAQIRTGRLDSDTLASAGFTPAQMQALQQTLASTKRGLADTAPPAAK